MYKSTKNRPKLINIWKNFIKVSDKNRIEIDQNESKGAFDGLSMIKSRNIVRNNPTNYGNQYWKEQIKTTNKPIHYQNKYLIIFLNSLFEQFSIFDQNNKTKAKWWDPVKGMYRTWHHLGCSPCQRWMLVLSMPCVKPRKNINPTIKIPKGIWSKNCQKRAHTNHFLKVDIKLTQGWYLKTILKYYKNNVSVNKLMVARPKQKELFVVFNTMLFIISSLGY